jgi:hypothetical protein
VERSRLSISHSPGSFTKSAGSFSLIRWAGGCGSQCACR